MGTDTWTYTRLLSRKRFGGRSFQERQLGGGELSRWMTSEEEEGAFNIYIKKEDSRDPQSPPPWTIQIPRFRNPSRQQTTYHSGISSRSRANRVAQEPVTTRHIHLNGMRSRVAAEQRNRIHSLALLIAAIAIYIMSTMRDRQHCALGRGRSGELYDLDLGPPTVGCAWCIVSEACRRVSEQGSISRATRGCSGTP